MSSHVFRGRVSIGNFCDRGSVYILKEVVRLFCIFLLFLLLLPYVHRSCDHLTYIVLIFWYIYMCVCVCWCMFIHLSLYVLFLFSLYAHASYLLYAIFYFCFTLRYCDEFCLKCFKNTGCQSLSCHELSSCKVFQEFVLG